MNGRIECVNEQIYAIARNDFLVAFREGYAQTA
jgi:hypothetical protein